MGKALEKPDRSSQGEYSAFNVLDGDHPWQHSVPEGYISYPVRELDEGEIAYFNFDLAKEMGLIPEDHPHRMNKKLEKKLIKTFSLRIINEYDQENDIEYPPKSIKPNEYMATRYLQLQHSNKKGETSGDGRCIWNGAIEHNGVVWDVSSRGTGVTALAPGAVEADEPLESGNTDYGYGCGLAEIDELYSAAIMAEIFHNKGINTERVLCVIDLGKQIGIGVRAGKNLLRPAHLFMHLKQENHDALKRATDYLIKRQQQNGIWSFGVQSKNKYDSLLEVVSEGFAKFAAQLDREYIFAWLDWDGDNVLADAGIIDYGSVRQFGLRHDQYRYDDVERWSTNLNEQKQKARLTVQVFAQMVDYLKTKNKKPIANFKTHKSLKNFDKWFEYYLLDWFLYQIGFKKFHRRKLLNKHQVTVRNLYRTFSQLEKVKTHKKPEKVADGINRPAIFNMRKSLIALPEALLARDCGWSSAVLQPEEFFDLILAEHAARRDSQLSYHLQKKIYKFQEQYKRLFDKLAPSRRRGELLQEIAERSQIINREDRITGNSLLFIVTEILKQSKKGLEHGEIQALIDNLIAEQIFQPEIIESDYDPKEPNSQRSKKLMKRFFTLVEGYKDDI